MNFEIKVSNISKDEDVIELVGVFNVELKSMKYRNFYSV